MTYPITLTNTAAPVLAWADESTIEDAALQQLRDVSELPGLHGLRVMPDVHFGKGATVGSVIAMEQALAPAAVGVDIGCGVNAVKTSLHLEDLTATDLAKLRSRFESVVPVGFAAHDSMRDSREALPSRFATAAYGLMGRFGNLHADVVSMYRRAAASLGTLGGGNHFIELTTDDDNAVWITLHSGSRGIGNQLAQRHMEVARDLPANADLPPHLRELSLFYTGTPEMDAYLHDLRWAQEYAMHSRTIMMELVKRELRSYFDSPTGRVGHIVTFGDEINCHHNYVSTEVIDGREMIVTRKGAISARSGELALIPGSMATGSYIVRGLGNPESFYSASHGAGRKMSRTKARKTYTAADVARTMQGIEARTDEGVVDEISLAYKDLDSVIAAQRDLVQPVARLQTILCVKG
ncbi:tRNA-splicing ligase RtcB [Microbacterium resistens]|uniref:3'-phosphate/5'-hydroxy nucleic acid ligase n=1 Tax=Microbacterium resistens TaxID=156977 RepID=A0ABU1SGI3_9MICO|nr:RtcB family protein [Microbacterium resistens]MDR6868700.1 tRNA-splicing ligase RtcB [Microbacterium resistens]